MRAPTDEARSFEAHLERDAKLSFIASSGARRTLTGVIRGVELLERTADGAIIVRYAFGPRFARLAERYWSRIHENLSVPAAIARVLTEHGVAHRFELSGEYPVREYQVQYQETDRAFVERIAAEVGLFYFFAGSIEGNETVLVFADANECLRAVDAPSELQVRAFEGSAADRPALREEQISAFRMMLTTAPTSLVGFDYDFTRPLHGLREQAERAPNASSVAGAAGVTEFAVPPGTVYEHRSDTERPELSGARAAAALDQWKADSRFGQCLAGSRLLAPGYRFGLARHPIDGLSRGYVVTSLKHVAYAEESAGRSAYQAELTCVVDTVVPRPARPPRRVVQVTESAVVVGPHGHEIHTDAHGRVRIRFHWDTRGSVELASCFVRVVQPWAGEGWGFQFIPRIGMEVLVTFLQGDPDVPVVMGALANATHPPPFPLPEQRSKSGIKTRSMPHGNGHNELSFDDAAGAERILVHAERDLREEVGHNRETHITNDDTCNVAGSARTHVHGTQKTTVDGTWSCEATANFQAKVLAGLSVKAYGPASVDFFNDVSLDSRGSSTLASRGPMRVTGGGAIRLGVADGNDQGELALSSEGRVGISATTDIALRATDRLRLTCGSSEILLEDGKVRITADAIELTAKKTFTATGDGPSLQLSDKAEFVGKEVRVLSEHASLELTTKARLRGEAIELTGPSKPDASDAKGEDGSTRTLDVTFHDEHRQPYEKATYVLEAGGERFQGTLDLDGRLKAKVPAEAETAQVTLWIDKYPEGRRRTYLLKIAELGDSRTVRGAKERLKMLGYFKGIVDDLFDAALNTAVAHFQSDRGIKPPNGRLTDETFDELTAAFGH